MPLRTRVPFSGTIIRALTRKTEIPPNFFSFNFLRVPGQKKGAGEGQATSYGGIPPKDLPRLLVMATQSGRPQQSPGPAMGSMKDCPSALA